MSLFIKPHVGWSIILGTVIMYLMNPSETVRNALKSPGLKTEIIEFRQSTKTSAEAADALGCGIGQIAKSLVMEAGNGAVLVVASGANRVDKKKVSRFLGKRAKMMEPEKVLETTGFEVGGVPPVGHRSKLRTLIDKDLLLHEIIYAAAGTSNTVFPLTPNDLIKITEGEVVEVKE